MDGSTNFGSTTAAGRSPDATRTAHPCCSPIQSCARQDVVAEYQRALAAGDADAIVAAFEPDGYAREPAGGQYVHTGPDDLRDFYELLFSNDGVIPLEHCTLIDDNRACAPAARFMLWRSTDLERCRPLGAARRRRLSG
jgi:hypothetical protein